MLMELRLPHHTVGCHQMSTMQTLPTSLLSFLNITCVTGLCLLPVRISFARKNVYICHDTQKVMTALQGAMKLRCLVVKTGSGLLCRQALRDSCHILLSCLRFLLSSHQHVLSCQRLSDFLLCCHVCTVSPYHAIKNKIPPMMRK